MRGGTFPDSEQAPHTGLLWAPSPPPRVSRKTRIRLRGLADQPPLPSQEQAQATGRQGQVFLPPLFALGRREPNPGASTTALPGWEQKKHLFGVWRLRELKACAGNTDPRIALALAAKGSCVPWELGCRAATPWPKASLSLPQPSLVPG